MADIFISYARSTAAQAQQMAEALRALGYGVWRDDELPAHRAYGDVIEERLKAAKAVVVIWSAEAVKSEWVRSEADRARNDRKLVQLTVDGAPLPMPFDQVQCANLSAWSGDLSSAGWRKVVASIADLMGGAAPAQALSGQSERAGISICVLPFANMSKDEDQEYFSDGISEDIITDLSKVSALGVMSRNSAFTFKGKHVDLPEVARQLKVSHVLEGSVRKSGNRVRITAQLIDGATNEHVWADRYDRNLDDIFALQDEISQAIVAALKLKLFPEEKRAIQDRGTTNLEAYDKFLRAQALANQAATADSQRAESLFREALAIDPGFSRARAGLCLVFIYRLNFSPERRAQTVVAMEAAVGEALGQAPDHWASHLANGLLLMMRHDWLGADGAFAKMKALSPPLESPAPLLYSFFLREVGRVSEAVGEIDAARTADPLSLQLSSAIQLPLYIAGRLGEARAEYERTLGLAGNREPMEHTALMQVWDSGDMALTKAQFRRFLDTSAVPMPVLSRVLDVIDQPAAALALIREAFTDPANQDSTRMFVLGWYAARFGDPGLAIDMVRRGYIDLGGIFLIPLWFPCMREARKTAACKQLVRDLGLYDYWRKSGKWGDFARPVGDDDFEIIR